MRVMIGQQPIATLALLLVPLIARSDVGADMQIRNDTTKELFVTVYDLSVHPRASVLATTITSFTSAPLSLTTDAVGQVNVAWTAVTTDPSDRQCGHGVRRHLKPSATVRVHAHGDCS
jgi:hypothetical protein